MILAALIIIIILLLIIIWELCDFRKPPKPPKHKSCFDY